MAGTCVRGSGESGVGMGTPDPQRVAREGREYDTAESGIGEIPRQLEDDALAGTRTLTSAGCKPGGGGDAAEADVRLGRAGQLFTQGKYDLALAEAFEFTKQRPGCIEGYVLCGKCLVKQERFQDALSAYRQGLEIDPNHKTIVADLKKMQEDIIAARDARGKEGEEDYNALRLCSQDRYPGDDELLRLEEEILEKKRLYDLPEFDNIGNGVVGAEIAGEIETVAAKARRQMEDGDMNSALDSYLTALQFDPTNADLWRERADILYQKGQHKEALRCCNAVAPGIRTPDIWKLGGKILRDLQFPVSAESWLRRASQLSKGNDEEAAIVFQQVRVQRLYGPLINGHPIKVDFTQYGRAVKTSAPVRKGEIVFGDAPLVLAQTLDSLNTPACSYCAKNLLRPEDYFTDGEVSKDPVLKKAVLSFWPEVKKIPCDHCGREIYCSKKCQKAAWQRHHQILCPKKNKASKKLYEVCDQYTGAVTGAMGAWTGVWNASYSPMVLARIWASIITEAKRQAKEDGLSKPTADQWSKAMSPYRRFIAYGSSSNAKIIPKMHRIMLDVFKDCGDGISYDITQREFDGRYFQATCNVQAFSDPDPPLKIFVEKVKATPQGNYVMDMLTHGQPEAVFAGMFSLHACINHSCDNNVEIMDGSIDGAAGVKVRAKKALKNDEELFTTYIDTTLPRKERRAWLHRAYNFWCNCDRCTYEGDGPEACTNCGTMAETGKKLPTCGKCRRAWYCSAKCQKDSWKKGHKKICKPLT